MIEMYRFLFLCILCILGIFFCFWQRDQCFKMSCSLVKYEEILENRKNIEREQLIKNLALSSWERIEKIAKNQIGLIFASKKEFLPDKQQIKKISSQKSLSPHFLNVHVLNEKKRSMELKEAAVLKKQILNKDSQLLSLSQKGFYLQEFFGPRFLQLADASHLYSSRVKKKI